MVQFFIIFPVHFLFQTVSVGVQTQFKVNRLQAGVKYVVQVRCVLDIGEWSEWSSERHIHIPNGEWMIAALLILNSSQFSGVKGA